MLAPDPAQTAADVFYAGTESFSHNQNVLFATNTMDGYQQKQKIIGSTCRLADQSGYPGADWIKSTAFV